MPKPKLTLDHRDLLGQIMHAQASTGFKPVAITIKHEQQLLRELKQHGLVMVRTRQQPPQRWEPEAWPTTKAACNYSVCRNCTSAIPKAINLDRHQRTCGKPKLADKSGDHHPYRINWNAQEDVF